MDSSDIKCFIKILGVRWNDFVTNDEVFRTNQSMSDLKGNLQKEAEKFDHAAILLSIKVAFQVLRLDS